MLIRRRLQTLKSVVEEYEMSVNIRFVSSCENKADVLTRVPQKWLSAASHGVTCAAVSGDEAATEKSEIRRVHEASGHPGVKRSLYFCRRARLTTTKREVREVVQECQRCLSIDPSRAHWESGELSVSAVWKRLAMDVTHVSGAHYLTIIDCGPSRFAVWRRLRGQNSASVIDQLEQLFCERGAPLELLTDNATAFRSAAFGNFAQRWGIAVRFRAAYAPSGNGVVERCHRTVKCIAARAQCSVTEAVYMYNVTPKDGTRPVSAPANSLYRYEVRVRGIDSVAEEPGVVVCTANMASEIECGCETQVTDVTHRARLGRSLR